MKTEEIRSLYLDFFKKKNHKMIASDSLIPQNDPSLLFTGAGMNQFKDYFLGNKTDMSRATSSQKCLRTGDLEEVGKTAFHHSFFEMLGNFSFGDYFKEEAITWAWEFLTSELKISKDRLRVSVHKDDGEAYSIWKDKIGIREDWIYKLGDKSNFWPANAPTDGPDGPCGPCSEIYYDQNPIDDKGHIESEDRRFAEIWNLVFTQYERQGANNLLPLKNNNIDTGMGLERLACVLQGKATNFETDLFQPIHQAVISELGIEGKEDYPKNKLYAISDHLRALVFTITDGALPSNEGRGYVVRKILRRALWYAYQIKEGGVKEPFLYKAISGVFEAMGKTYPEIMDNKESLSATILEEEKRFLKTLESGIQILEKKLNRILNDKKTVLDAEDSFELYDTYGFPEELTQMICEEKDIQIDKDGFSKLMEEQRNRSKASSQMSDSIFSSSGLENIPKDIPETKFLGYEQNQATAKILWHEMSDNKKGVLILDQTPFYAESGGQIGDQGIIQSKSCELRVLDVQKLDSYSMHYFEIAKGNIENGLSVECSINTGRQLSIMRNHTATHLLHAALRQVLGNQVRQLGSLVADDRLRFDFSYGKALTKDQISEIELIVQEEILKNTQVVKEEKDIESAKKDGAIAFFGDKYGDRVRVVSVSDFSKEFCGGIHCQATGDIGTFVIISESSVASGVRRLEALTGKYAFQYFQGNRKRIEKIANTLRVPENDIELKVTKLQDSIKKLEKQKSSGASGKNTVESLIQQAEQTSGVSIIYQSLSDINPKDLREISDSIKNQSQKTIYFLFSKSEDKLHSILSTSKDLEKSKINLRDIFSEISKILPLKGGGRPDFIQAGGPVDLDAMSKKDQVLEIIENFIKEKAI